MKGFGVIVSERRAFIAARMPQGNYFEYLAANAVVNEVSDAREVQPSDYISTRRFNPGAEARLLNQQRYGSLSVFADGSRCSEPILSPPFGCSLDLALRAGFDSDAERQDQPKRRSRAKNSSAGTPSSRSASLRAARSSASSCEDSLTTASSPRARIVTAVPSGRERPSTTTLPPTTVPETTCMKSWYPTR